MLKALWSAHAMGDKSPHLFASIYYTENCRGSSSRTTPPQPMNLGKRLGAKLVRPCACEQADGMTSQKVMPPFNAFAKVVLRPLEHETANMKIRRNSTLAGGLCFQERAGRSRNDRSGSVSAVHCCIRINARAERINVVVLLSFFEAMDPKLKSCPTFLGCDIWRAIRRPDHA